MIGQTISHYKITDKLGEGGMGVVYKADDTKLDRPVALKFLAPHLLRDEEGRKRFEREAKSAAKLDHPNICTVHEIDEVDGRTFIVMAFLEGQPLGERIKDGPLKLPEALSVAIQMAEGLEAAHEKGITHRDIKPDNVMLMAGSRGLVKLMDFGLAQLAGSSKFTREGTTLGTPIYMSPEQALGEPTDRRSDVWGLGVVLYEMVAGRPPFQGEVDQAVIYSIANEQPEPLTAVRTGVPKELERIVDKCLAKDVEERYQHVTDLLVDLQSCRRVLDSGTEKGVPSPAPARRMSGAGWGIVTAVIVAVAATTWWFGGIRERQTSVPEYSLRQLTHDTGLTHQPAISKDGTMVAYASDRAGEGNLDIWVQQVAGADPIQVTDHEANDEWPDFSPDGSQIVFGSDRDGGGIFVAPAFGGSAPRRVAAEGGRPRFSPDGQSVAYSESAPSGWSVYIAEMSGGSLRKVETGTTSANYPVWSPDGRHILFNTGPEGVAPTQANMDWWVVPAEGGAAVQTGARAVLDEAGLTWRPFRDAPPHWLGDPDRLVFSTRSGDTENVYELPLSPGTWEPAGTPVRLMQGTVYAQPSAAAEGRIAFATLTGNKDIWSMAMDPNRPEIKGEPEPLFTSALHEWYPTVSSDGRKVAFLRGPQNKLDLFVRDTETRRETPLVVTPENEHRAFISPDGETVAFVRWPYMNSELLIVPSAGGAEQKVADGVATLFSWAGDSRRIVCGLNKEAQGYELVTIDVFTKEAVGLLPEDNGVAALSPDGSWVSFTSREPTRALFVAPVRDGAASPRSEWIEISRQPGVGRNRWSPNGEVLYFSSRKHGHPCIWAQRLHPESKQPVGEAKHVFGSHEPSRVEQRWPYGLGPDRIYLSVEERTSNIWLAEPVEE